MGKGAGVLGAMIDGLIYPLLYAANAAVFVAGIIMAAAGGYLMGGYEKAAVGAAVGVFAVGCFCMYLAGFALLGLLKKSAGILAIVSILLLLLLAGLFAVIIVCLALGLQLPSLRDVVADNWHEGCPNPSTDTEGCLQADLVNAQYCFKSIGPPLCADESMAAQKVHACAIACQTQFANDAQDYTKVIALFCIIAFLTLIAVVIWNSQTHHGLWCFAPTDDGDVNAEDVQDVGMTMAVPAYFLNGLLGLCGLVLMVAVSFMDGDATFFKICVGFLGFGYFVCAGLACFAINKNIHMVLRVVNLVFLASSMPLLGLSVVAGIYSGEIENLYDFYEDNWCDIRAELDTVEPDYCNEPGGKVMGDTQCKDKILQETADNLTLIGLGALIALVSIACDLWFTMRISRKFKFESRDVDDSEENPVASDDDSKGGDDDDDDDDDEGDGPPPWVLGLLIGVPTLFVLIAVIWVLLQEGDNGVVGTSCAGLVVTAQIDIDGIKGFARFQQKRPMDTLEVDVEFTSNPDGPTVDGFKIHKFPVIDPDTDSFLATDLPASQACSQNMVGGMIPNGDLVSGEVGLTAESDAQGETNSWFAAGGETLGPESLMLYGERSIIGRSVVFYHSGSPVACATIRHPAAEQVSKANFTMARGPNSADIKGSIYFSQVVSRGHNSNMTIFVKLEATGTVALENPGDCSDIISPLMTDMTGAADLSFCGLKLEVHDREVPPDGEDDIACQNTTNGGIGPLWTAGKDVDAAACAAAGGYVKKMSECAAGDIFSKFGAVDVGVAGTPKKYFFVDTALTLRVGVGAQGQNSISSRSVSLLEADDVGGDGIVCATLSDPIDWSFHSVQEMSTNDMVGAGR